MDNMSKEARAARNAYRRKWYAANKDKCKASQARYWAKKAAEMKLQQEQQQAASN